jgi:tetratricopeptide (TPR) repeat protein
MTTSKTNPGNKVGRARRSPGQLWQVPTFLFGALALFAVAASAPWRHTPEWRDFDRNLSALREALSRHEPATNLVGLAQHLDVKMPHFPDRAAEAHFLIGSAYYRQARQVPPAVAQDIWPRAIEHLERANAVADADHVAQQYRLGFCLYQQKREVPRAIEMMLLSIDKAGEQPLEGYRLLVEAQLARTPANVEGALSANQRVLDLTPEGDAEALALARLQQGELLLRKQARSDAAKELERIGAKASRPVRVKARLLQIRCCEEDHLWQKAAAIWQELLNEAAFVEGGRARIQYALGWSFYQMDPPNHAETLRAWSDALKAGGAEGQAAGLRLGELRLSMGPKEAGQGLADWREALAGVQGPSDFKNPYIKATEVCELFDHAINLAADWQDPEKTQQILELYRKLAPSGSADQRLADAAEKRAVQLAEMLKNMVGTVTALDVEAQYRLAADLHASAAKAVPVVERPESLWRSGLCYLSAKMTAKAQAAFKEHVLIEKDEARLAESWFTQGDLYFSAGDKVKARVAFVKCIEYPNTKFAFRSKYFLALDEIDHKNYERAYAILKENLGARDAVDRATLEKTQFKMAWLVMQMNRFEEAHIHLKECRRLYPENPNIPLAQEQLGECCRKLAKKEQQAEREVLAQITADLAPERRAALEDTARQHKRARVDWLKEAVKSFEELTDELRKQQARTKKPLSTLEEILLRRARFGVGECHLDNEEFTAAAEAFRKLQADQRRTLESFYACLRICNMLDVMHARQLPKEQIEEGHKAALESLNVLNEDLKNLPDDHDLFRQPGVVSRAEWQRWHDAVLLRLLAPAKGDRLPPLFQ